MTIQLGFALHPKWVEQEGLQGFLSPLEAEGLTALEFTLHPGTDEWEGMRDLAVACAQAGYPCHFHAPYRDPFNIVGFASGRRAEVESQFAPALALVERLAEAHGWEPALVIHGAHAPAGLPALVEDTHALLDWVLAQAPHARPMLEILPPKPGFVRVGERRSQLLDLLHAVNHPRLKLCWDLGHDVLQGYSDLPSVEFLQAVGHVHIHDLNAAGEDHFPLVYGVVPWRQQLAALQQAGFQGVVTLEINGYRALQLEDPLARLAESFAAMRRVLGLPAPRPARGRDI